MRDSGSNQDLLRVASVIPSINAGGVGSVCRYAAAGIARSRDWQVSLLCLHDPVGEGIDSESGLRMAGLGLTSTYCELDLVCSNESIIMTP